MEIIQILKVETLPLATDEISVYVTALIDFDNEHPELVETSFEYVPSEWSQDESIQDYTESSKPLSEGQLKVLTQWIEALRSDQNDWYSTDNINLLQEYS